MANFVSYANAQDLMGAIAARFNQLGAALQYRGTTAFAGLPATLTADMTGYVYNISDNFTTDSRFVEGSGKSFSAGTDVCVVNVGTKAQPEMKFNVGANFVDLTPINNRITATQGDIAPAFDATQAYSVGNKVIYQDHLYIFTQSKAAGAWDATKATSIDIITLTDATNTNVTRLQNDIAPAFSEASAYSEGDKVMYEGQLYAFSAAKTAGAWDSTKVTAVNVVSLIKSAEPDSLTSAQIDALEDLLD